MTVPFVAPAKPRRAEGGPASHTDLAWTPRDGEWRDLVGSRGPDHVHLWPLFYFGPFAKDPMWIWKGQLALDSWPNRLLTVCLFAWALWLAVRLGYSFVGVFSKRLDQVFVGVLRKWYGDLIAWRKRCGQSAAGG